MATHTALASLASLNSPIEDYAQDLVALTLRQRATLPLAANNKPMAPSNAFAAQVRKDIASNNSREFVRLLAADVTDLRDGVPATIVKEKLRRWDAIIDVEAGAYRPRSLVALNRRETREECLVNLAQLRIGPEHENDLESLHQLKAELTSYRVILDEIDTETDRRIAYLQSGPTGPSSPLSSALASATSSGRHGLVVLK